MPSELGKMGNRNIGISYGFCLVRSVEGSRTAQSREKILVRGQPVRLRAQHWYSEKHETDVFMCYQAYGRVASVALL